MTPFISSLLQTLPSITRVGSAKTRVASGTLTINKPAGVQAGDLLLAFVIQQGTSAITSPGGWTELIDSGGLAVAWLRAGAGEPSNYSFSGGTGAVGGVIVAYRAASYDVVGAASTNGTASSITLSKNDSVELAFFAYVSGTTITGPSDMTTVETDTNTPPFHLLEKLHLAAGATGTKTATGIVSDSIQVGLKPRWR